jgi:hypothetical protein
MQAITFVGIKKKVREILSDSTASRTLHDMNHVCRNETLRFCTFSTQINCDIFCLMEFGRFMNTFRVLIAQRSNGPQNVIAVAVTI